MADEPSEGWPVVHEKQNLAEVAGKPVEGWSIANNKQNLTELGHESSEGWSVVSRKQARAKKKSEKLARQMHARVENPKPSKKHAEDSQNFPPLAKSRVSPPHKAAVVERDVPLPKISVDAYSGDVGFQSKKAAMGEVVVESIARPEEIVDEELGGQVVSQPDGEVDGNMPILPPEEEIEAGMEEKTGDEDPKDRKSVV